MTELIDSITVTTPALKGEVVLHNLTTVGNRKFFKVCKSDRRISRLLRASDFVAASSGERPLTNTTLIEELIGLRNNERQRLIDSNSAAASAAMGVPEDDLCLDGSTSKRPRRASPSDSALPDTVCIQAPSVADVSGISMLVVLGQPKSPLWVELTVDNIDYLRAAICSQMASCDAGSSSEEIEADKVTSPGQGIVWVPNRTAFRVRYKLEGKVKSKDIRAESSEPSAIAAASKAALRFKASVCS